MDELSAFCVKNDEFALGMDKAMTERFEGQPTRKGEIRGNSSSEQEGIRICQDGNGSDEV